MNIAYFCADRGVPVLGHKGASVHVREFVTALAGLGHEVTVLCANSGAGNACPPVRMLELAPGVNLAEVLAEGASLGVSNAQEDRVLRRELSELVTDRRLAARVLACLEEANVRPDALYERYSLFHRAGEQVATALKIPRVLEMNAPLVEEQERFRGLRLKAIAEDAERDTLCSADHIVAVSAAVKEGAMARGVPPERITVLPNGVDAARFHPEVDARPVRERYGLANKSIVGFVGSLKPWHGLHFLLDAFVQIAADRADAMLMIVGDGPGMADLRLRVGLENLSERVILTGRVSYAEVPAHLAAMDVTVAPYTAQDGFYFSPLKVVESLASGRPVVAPKLGQLADLIEDGVTGLLFPPGDVQAFVHQVVALLKDRPRLGEMGRAAAVSARARFSWEKNAHYVTKLMAQLSQGEGAR